MTFAFWVLTMLLQGKMTPSSGDLEAPRSSQGWHLRPPRCVADLPHPKNEAVWLAAILVIASKRHLHSHLCLFDPCGLTDCSHSRPLPCRDGVHMGHPRSPAAAPTLTLCVAGQSLRGEETHGWGKGERHSQQVEREPPERLASWRRPC